jgi:hypothetical protein
MINVKLAVPHPVGVPLIVYVIVPLPDTKFPADSVAVKPRTPVDATDCAL